MKIVVMHMYEERGISHEPFQVVFCLVSHARKHVEPPLLRIAPVCRDARDELAAVAATSDRVILQFLSWFMNATASARHH
jgi:hypothetical protein